MGLFLICFGFVFVSVALVLCESFCVEFVCSFGLVLLCHCVLTWFCTFCFGCVRPFWCWFCFCILCWPCVFRFVLVVRL